MAPTEPKKILLNRFVELNKNGHIQRRDIEILKDLYKFRFMTASQVERLFFNNFQACRRRLLKLYNYGLLERFRHLSSEYIYCLGSVGAYFLAQAYGRPVSDIKWRKRDNAISLFFIHHYLETVDTYIELTRFDLRKILAYPDFKYFRPDLYAEIVQSGYRYYFFIEVDRATERQQKIVNKQKAYDKYLKSAQVQPRLIFKAPDIERLKQLNKWLRGSHIVTTDLYKTICELLTEV